ncbi:Fasciclin-like arabinogalactan protein 11 [Zostera marina]|uniref:Fasciclin-like arabinogalactan protein 11 n=1 Tax=Zostera marina TaxID=29655 RepID=A0A0K9Q3S0_ZOSMR|nr:Fasciclin-like arabinogalactan protein 11 [Zostera marina]
MSNQAFLLLLFLPLLLADTASQAGAQPLLSALTQHLDVTEILEKAGHFDNFVALLQATGLDKQINQEANQATSEGITLFAPADSAFTGLTSEKLGALSDKARAALVKYHVLPFLVTSISVFEDMTKQPLRTMGYTGKGVPLNVITTAGHHVNLTTGLVNTRVGDTVFSGGKLAVYHLDRVLFPPDLFGSKASAPTTSSAPTMSLSPRERQKKLLPEDANFTESAAAGGLCRLSLMAVGGGAALLWLL